MKVLTEIMSIHEQREMFFNPDAEVKKGVWLEVINFNPHSEEAKVLRRWQVENVEESIEGNVRTYRIDCKDLDVDVDLLKKKTLAKLIVNKHHDKLKASFVKCLVDGIERRNISELRSMLFKLGGKLDKQKDS